MRAMWIQISGGKERATYQCPENHCFSPQASQFNSFSKEIAKYSNPIEKYWTEVHYPSILNRFK